MIGDQVWLAKNLEVTKFQNGTNISNVLASDQWEGQTTPAYSRYNNESGNAYGLLYNGYAISTDEVCPEGWHLPTISEWSILFETVGGEEVAGGKLKEYGTNHWSSPNTAATDEFGFTALPGGLRYITGTFLNQGEIGYWWAAPDDTSNDLPAISMSYDSESADPGGSGLKFGLSVRCVKDQ